MQLKINKKTLEQSLNNITKALNNNSALNALQGILINVNESKLELIASNGNLSIKTFIQIEQGIEIIEPGKILIPGRLFREVIKSQSKAIELIVKNNQLKIKSQNNETNLNLLNVQDYPTINFESFGKELIIDTELFRSMIKDVSFAAAIDDKRIILNGVNIFAKNKQLTMVATNSFRLAQECVDIGSGIDFNIAILSKNLRDFIPASAKGDIKISVNDTKIITNNKNTTIVLNLIDGIYPNVSKLIPNDFIGKLKISKREIESLVDQVSVLTSEGLCVTKLDITSKTLILKSKREEIGETIVKAENFIWEGIDQFSIVFNVRFFKEALSKFKDEIEINFTGAQKPIVIKSTSNSQLIQLILPHRSY